MRMTKAERFFSMEDKNCVLSKIYCKLNCMQPYSRKKILVLQNQMWRDSDVRLRKHIKLKVHIKFYNDTSSNQMVTLEGINVCSTVW